MHPARDVDSSVDCARDAVVAREKSGDNVSVSYDYELDDNYEVTGESPRVPDYVRDHVDIHFWASATLVEIRDPREEQLAILKRLDGFAASA